VAEDEAREHGQVKRQRYRWWKWLLAPVVVYVLSIGPVMKMTDAGLIDTGTWCAFYSPLLDLCESNTYLNLLLVWYFHAWRIDGYVDGF
jgi:hypothetical protein